MKINEFPELTTLTDDDLLLGYSSGQEAVGVIKLSTLKSFLNAVIAPSLPTLTFASSGDSNGICYWLATRGGSSWSNPHTADKVTVSSK